MKTIFWPAVQLMLTPLRARTPGTTQPSIAEPRARLVTVMPTCEADR